MKKDLLIISSLFFLSIVITCCKKDKPQPQEEPEKSQPQLKADSTSLTLKPAAGSRDSFSIQSNIDFTISINPASAASWLKTSVTSGSGNAKIYVTTETANTSTTAQSATITIDPVNNSVAPSVNLPVTQRTFQISEVWSKLYGGAAEDGFKAIVPCGDGTYMAVGSSKSNSGDIYGSNGAEDYWIVKINGNGDKIWSKVYGGSASDNAQAIVRTTDGGYIVTGHSNSTDGDVVGGHGYGAFDIWVVKLDASGNKLWAKTFGGSGNDFGSAVIATPNGGSLVVGESQSFDGDISGHLGSGDMWVIKLDANGNKLLAKNFGTSSGEIANAIAAAPDGGYVLAGNIVENTGFTDAIVVKLDADFNQQWVKTFGGTGYDHVNKVTITADGGYLFIGDAGSKNGEFSTNKGSYDAWAVKLDASGNKVWSKMFGGSSEDRAFEVIATADNGFLVAGFSDSNDGDVSNNAGYDDMWMFKLNAAGSKVWEKAFGGSYGDAASAACATDAAGSFILAGYTYSNNGAVSGNHGQRDAWILKITE